MVVPARRCVILSPGGSALVRRWIQTPSVAKVLSAATRRGRSSSELPLRPAPGRRPGRPVGLRRAYGRSPHALVDGVASDASAAPSTHGPDRALDRLEAEIKGRQSWHSRWHQRVRADRAQLLPGAPGARRRHRDRRRERPRRRRDDGAPAQVRLGARPARRRRVALGDGVDHASAARRSSCSPSATRRRCRGATSASTSCSSRPASSRRATARRSTSTRGAKKVVISAPATDPDVTLVLGVNDDAYDPRRSTTSSRTPRARRTASRRSRRCCTTRSGSSRAS